MCNKVFWLALEFKEKIVPILTTFDSSILMILTHILRIVMNR